MNDNSIIRVTKRTGQSPVETRISSWWRHPMMMWVLGRLCLMRITIILLIISIINSWWSMIAMTLVLCNTAHILSWGHFLELTLIFSLIRSWILLLYKMPRHYILAVRKNLLFCESITNYCTSRTLLRDHTLFHICSGCSESIDISSGRYDALMIHICRCGFQRMMNIFLMVHVFVR